MIKRVIPFVFVLALAIVGVGQEKPVVIQFTGVVMGQDSLQVIPGAHVYIPKGGRGTTTNPYGFFSLPVLAGDSIVFTAVGYKRTNYIIPEHDPSTSLKVILTLEEDVTFLQEVEVFPFPNEEMFKRAVVTMELPYNRDNANLQAWLQATYMKGAPYGYFAASQTMNQRYFEDRQRQEFRSKFGPSTNNLLNPWAWSSFIRSVKNN